MPITDSMIDMGSASSSECKLTDTDTVVLTFCLTQHLTLQIYLILLLLFCLYFNFFRVTVKIGTYCIKFLQCKETYCVNCAQKEGYKV